MSTGEALTEVGQLGGRLGGLGFRGNHAFLAIGPRLIVLDVSDPVKPKEVGRSRVLPGNVKSIDIEGPHAWVGLSTGAMACIDISVPEHPRLLSIMPLGITYWNSHSTIEVSGTKALVGTDRGVVVVDISSPHAPRSITVPAWTARGVAHDRGIIAVAGGDGGLRLAGWR